MILNRRMLLAAASGLAVWPAFADEAPPALAAYERETGGRIGVYAENLTTRREDVWRADERFVMCSTFKASLAAFVLTRVDRGEDQLERDDPLRPGRPSRLCARRQAEPRPGAMSVREMCEAAVEHSDNTCANLLLARVGGPSALTAFWRATGDTVTRLDHNEPVLNRSPPGDPHDTTTPAAMAGKLRRLVLGDVLSPASRERLTAGWWTARPATTGCAAACPRIGRSATRPATTARMRSA